MVSPPPLASPIALARDASIPPQPANAASFSSSASFSALISAQITFAPQRANSSTVALPIPDTPPVIIAVLPSSRMDRTPSEIYSAARSSHSLAPLAHLAGDDRLLHLGRGLVDPRRARSSESGRGAVSGLVQGIGVIVVKSGCAPVAKPG